MASKLIFLFFIHVWLEGSLAQHSQYSLQAAVDALHRREAQLALKDNYNIPSRYGIPPPAAQEQDYWDDDSETGPLLLPSSHSNNRHKLNRILAKYLAREEDNARNGGGLGPVGGYEFDDDNYIPEEKKRSSFFRERDGKDDPSASRFRERDNQPFEHAELTDQFLKEIEEARELDREERYKEALRRIWEKYQQQENDIEGQIFEDQKRMVPQPNYYIGPLMQKKRTYPVLPWLPMSRRKRFPVAKRSPKLPFDDSSKSNAERVPDELRELFGKPNEEKKKRSADDQSTDEPVEKKNEKNTTSATIEPHTEHPPHGGHHHKEHKHRKRSDHSHESQEEEEEESEEHEPEHEEHEEEEDEEEHERDDFEDEEEAQKKKRETSERRMQKRSNLEIVKEDQILPGDLSNFRRKKSVDWSKYFGIDRRKKSVYDNGDSKKHNPIDEDEDDEEKRKKKNIDPDRLSNMGKKLQSIEDLIIDETVKYTGAHEGIADPEEIARLKDHVVSRLATAYSLEKMRRALEKLRQSVDNENHLLRNVVESDSKSDDDSEIEKQKRLSVKKEKVEFQGMHHSINTPNTDKSKDVQGNSMTSDSDVDEDEEEKKKKKQKKRNGYQRYPEIPNDVSEFEEEIGAGHYEPLNDAYLGNKNYIPGSSQCPLIDSMAERCRGVDLLSGDINQELLPICGVHQICYLCGTSQVACDFQYLAEADSICGHNNDCQAAARSVLMILRGSPGPQLGPKECIKNPCLNRAMREIGL